MVKSLDSCMEIGSKTTGDTQVSSVKQLSSF